MSRWESIEAFVSVVHCKSFSKAAEDMGVSKSHISRQISQLENRLDAQLLIRTTRKITLTEVGRAFYLRCNDILTTLNDAEQAVVDLQEKPQGRLRLTAAGGFGEDYVAPAAIAFMKLYPELSVEIDFNNRVVDLISEGYDLPIRAGSLKDSSLIARRIASREMCICASPEYLELKGTPESIAHLDHHNCLVGTLHTWRFRDNKRDFDQRIDGNWRSNNGRALLHAAIGGLGIVQLPRFYVNEALQQNLLVEVLEDFKPDDTAFWAVYPHNRHLSGKVRLFVNFLAEEFNPEGFS